MSKHSNSMRTNSLTSPMTSFFDTGPGDDRFWQAKAKETEFVDVPKIVEGEFRIYHKTFFKEWDKCRLSIRGNFLVFKKKKSSKNVEFLDFHKNMYRFEIISEIHKKHSAKYPHGFSLYSNGVSMEFFCKDSTQVISWMSHLRQLCIMTNFNDNYKVLEVLGSGGYGKVHMIDSIQDSRKFAGKFIKISSTMNRERQKTMIVNEIRMLRKLDHPQIVKLFEVYEMPGQICLVMELVQGEKLFSYITERKSLSEEATAYLMKQLLIILSHLESQDIIHRDIKPENILYTLDENGKVQLKLIDFGLATFNKKRDMIKKCGTAGYVAPEILNNDAYNFKADLYSAGVIMYICLTGRPLFHAKDYDELLAKNRSGVIKYRGSTWSRLSAEAQDLVQRLLDPIPSFRISLADALNHEWFIHNIDPEDRKDLLDHIFKVVKLNIPQEKTISRIPTTSGKIPYVQKSNALSLPSISSHQRNVSGSFFTSNVQLGIDDHHKELHPFYKIISSEASNPSHLSHLSISVTNSSASGNQSKTLNGIPVAVTPLKGNTLRLPTIAPNSPRRQNQSLRSSLKTIEPHRYAGGYSIQVSAAESHDDLEVGFEGEGSLCSTNYEDLKRNPFRFARLGRRINTYSFTEAGTAPIRIHSNRCETEIETPRNKFRVVPVNSGLRKQVAESFC